MPENFLPTVPPHTLLLTLTLTRTNTRVRVEASEQIQITLIVYAMVDMTDN